MSQKIFWAKTNVFPIEYHPTYPTKPETLFQGPWNHWKLAKCATKVIKIEVFSLVVSIWI